MQKRTNPLALKGEAKTESDILREKEIVLDPVVAPKKAAERTVKLEKVSMPAPRTDKPASMPASMPANKPSRSEDFRMAKSVTMDSGATSTYAATAHGVVATRTEPPVVQPDPTDDWLDEVEISESEQFEEEAFEDGLLLDEQSETAQDATPAPSEVIEDEEVFPTLQDFELAARFTLRGRCSRKLVMGKISRDVLRLAQLLHPDEKLSAVIESALLTRIFLENPEAFDAMAAVIEENGGRIKC